MYLVFHVSSWMLLVACEIQHFVVSKSHIAASNCIINGVAVVHVRFGQLTGRHVCQRCAKGDVVEPASYGLRLGVTT